jgi:hypothetical protein
MAGKVTMSRKAIAQLIGKVRTGSALCTTTMRLTAMFFAQL